MWNWNGKLLTSQFYKIMNEIIYQNFTQTEKGWRQYNTACNQQWNCISLFTQQELGRLNITKPSFTLIDVLSRTLWGLHVVRLSKKPHAVGKYLKKHWAAHTLCIISKILSKVALFLWIDFSLFYRINYNQNCMYTSFTVHNHNILAYC